LSNRTGDNHWNVRRSEALHRSQLHHEHRRDIRRKNKNNEHSSFAAPQMTAETMTTVGVYILIQATITLTVAMSCILTVSSHSDTPMRGCSSAA